VISDSDEVAESGTGSVTTNDSESGLGNVYVENWKSHSLGSGLKQQAKQNNGLAPYFVFKTVMEPWQGCRTWIWIKRSSDCDRLSLR
jgi:hypothetical protein